MLPRTIFKKGHTPWNKLDLDEDTIVDLYINKKKSTIEIAKIMGCSSSSIRKRLIKNNIKRRNPSEAFLNCLEKGWHPRKLNLPEEEICKKYDESNISAEGIAKGYRCSKQPIYDILERKNIQIKTPGFYCIGKEGNRKGSKLTPEQLRRHIEIRNIPEYIKNAREKNLGENNPFFGKTHTPEIREIIRKTSTERWQDPIYKEKVIKLMMKGLFKRPTSYEKKIAELCIENSLPFIYTGNGKFLINFKNPDFTDFQNNVVIEVFYSWFKIRDYGSVEAYKKYCIEKYNPAGWKVIFIDENEVDVDNWKELCLNKIQGVSNE